MTRLSNDPVVAEIPPAGPTCTVKQPACWVGKIPGHPRTARSQQAVRLHHHACFHARLNCLHLSVSLAICFHYHHDETNQFCLAPITRLSAESCGDQVPFAVTAVEVVVFVHIAHRSGLSRQGSDKQPEWCLHRRYPTDRNFPCVTPKFVGHALTPRAFRGRAAVRSSCWEKP